ncbi:type II toxin-antitoxin system VapC family toxin [Synechococcus sp. PCC 7336]|uniref:type II toxin-antitoxin system tRNA(fMet)-specific endonuclease VapC n=1 Tax=Synechococcus sp. PCC 7336 TaxID=195250 RepID=UPI00034830FA|nr:type II toxin-antitoxin system VapC family toxin [Synechococcus sp. PCC 7336]
MKILLDTDICIYAINRKNPKPLQRLRSYAISEVGISAITYAELRFGIENSSRVTANLDRLERFLLPLEIVPFDAEAGRCYGRVRTQLKRKGLPIGGNDLLIAGHALSLGATLATNNVREFARVEGLRVEQWT